MMIAVMASTRVLLSLKRPLHLISRKDDSLWQLGIQKSRSLFPSRRTRKLSVKTFDAPEPAAQRSRTTPYERLQSVPPKARPGSIPVLPTDPMHMYLSDQHIRGDTSTSRIQSHGNKRIELYFLLEEDDEPIIWNFSEFTVSKLFAEAAEHKL